ncbi:MAG TPA: TetR/AcrR family transcriptional regulator, partial [Thermoanaerobacterales bacterium]|nr:TetR/AcrR family transcriptional regulator [Thermoanaerobacterales bacterium]
MESKDQKEDLTERRKTQIAEAAVKVFVKKGYEGSTTKEIAKKARVSEGTIFRYFKTKKDILLYVIILLTERVIAELNREIEDCTDPKEALKMILRLHYRLIIKNYDMFKVVIYEIQFHKDLQENFYKKIVKSMLHMTEKTFREYKDDINVEPRAGAEALLGIFFGIMLVRNAIKQADE